MTDGSGGNGDFSRLSKLSLSCFYIMLSAVLVVSGCRSEKASSDFPVLRGPYFGQKLPAMIPKLFAPGIISFGFHENGIVFSPDGNEMFFSMCDSKYSSKTFFRSVQVNGLWTAPETASFVEDYYHHSLFYSPDGSKIYFSSSRPIEDGGADKSDLDVWVIEKQNEGWGKPEHLPGPLNTDKSEQITSIAANGTIYLRTNYEGRKWSIYRSLLIDGEYAPAERLGERINAGYNEGNPCVSPDESFMVFKSGRPGGYGGTDLYISFRAGNGSWGEPTNLGDRINSPEHELEPRLSPDGKYFFYSSFRKPDPSVYRGKTYAELLTLYRSAQNGYGTLYWVDAKILGVR